MLNDFRANVLKTDSNERTLKKLSIFVTSIILEGVPLKDFVSGNNFFFSRALLTDARVENIKNETL